LHTLDFNSTSLDFKGYTLWISVQSPYWKMGTVLVLKVVTHEV